MAIKDIIWGPYFRVRMRDRVTDGWMDGMLGWHGHLTQIAGFSVELTITM